MSGEEEERLLKAEATRRELSQLRKAIEALNRFREWYQQPDKKLFRQRLHGGE